MNIKVISKLENHYKGVEVFFENEMFKKIISIYLSFLSSNI
jgi:hypothetical protein